MPTDVSRRGGVDFVSLHFPSEHTPQLPPVNIRHKLGPRYPHSYYMFYLYSLVAFKASKKSATTTAITKHLEGALIERMRGPRSAAWVLLSRGVKQDPRSLTLGSARQRLD